MRDTRFTTFGGDLEAVLEAADLDSIDDLDTLLMALLHRPVRVRESWEEDEDLPGLEVIISAGERAYGTVFAYPTSILEMTRHSVGSVDGLGPYPEAEPMPEGAPVLSSLDDAGLIASLQEALGMVRLFNLMADVE